MKNQSTLQNLLIKKSWILTLPVSVLLTGCSSWFNPPQPQIITPVTQVVEKPVQRPVSSAPSKAEFITSLDPDIRKAYLEYQKTGKAPTIETQDFLQFPFGQTEPLIYCQPIHSCDVTLQAGESITGVYPGDTARWKYVEGVSGVGSDAQPHLIFKPTDYDLSTNVVITTTKRTYHLGLVSKQDSYVRQVSFWYPDDIEAQWQKVNQDAESKWQGQNQTEFAQLPDINLNNVDFNYNISTSFLSSPAWKPLRAFNDGTHVYIEMPPAMRTTDAPALFTISSDQQKALVNYRVRGNYYIVDQLFKQAVMVAGVGSAQERVTITYKG